MTETAGGQASEMDLDSLINQAPLSLEYMPEKTIMQRLIIKATQIKSASDLDI